MTDRPAPLELPLPWRRLDYMTAAEVEDFLAHSDAAIIPVGPTEAHGVHLPLACDVLVATAAATIAAQAADALVFPPFSYSWAGGTSSLPGTIPIAPELVFQFLMAIGQGAMGKGFRRLVFVSGHAPDAMTVNLTARRLYEMTGTPVVSCNVPGARNSTPRMRELFAPLQEAEGRDPGAGESSLLAASLRVLGLEEHAPVRLDLPARPAVPLMAGDRKINRSGATVGRYFTDLSQHIPKPQTLLVDEALAYLQGAAEIIADALAELRTYAPEAAAIATRTGLR